MYIQFVGVGLIASSCYIFLKFVMPLRSLLVSERRCPRCGITHSLTRIPRLSLDRFVNSVISCRRYQCFGCLWSGLLREKVSRHSRETAFPSDEVVPIFKEVQETRA